MSPTHYYVHHGYAEITYADGVRWTSTSGPFASFTDASSFAANNAGHRAERVKINTSATLPENKKKDS